MTRVRERIGPGLVVAISAWLLAFTAGLARAADPLPSWQPGPSQQRIVAFVKAVTERGGPDYVVPAERIAVFDNDGTLWGEQPAYFQLAFAVDRVRALAPARPEWATTQPFKGALEGDVKALAATGEKGLLEQVIGSSVRTRYEVRDGRPVIVRLPEMEFIDDKAGKPVGIHKFIGRRPIAAFGNSDGDFEMLEYVTAGPGRRLGLLVHHDDAAREYAYDRESHVGRLARGLDEATARGWLVVSMKRDWRSVYPPVR